MGVNVYIKNTHEGSSTNAKGKFNLELPGNTVVTDTIYFSHVGYLTKKMSISEFVKTNHVVYLFQDIQNLTEVIIVSDKSLNPTIHYNKLSSFKDGVYSFGALLIGDYIYIEGGDESFKTEEALKAYDNYKDLGLVEFLKRIPPNDNWDYYNGSLQIYDIKTDTWRLSNSEFRERAYHNMHYFNGRIYIIGGKRLSMNRKYEYLDDKIEVFDLNNDTILIDDTNPHQAVNFASIMFDGNIVVFGGSNKIKQNGKKEYSNKVHLFNIETGYWYELEDMPSAKEVNGILVKNKVYLIGGYNNKALNSIETFDLNTGKWETEGSLFIKTIRPAITYNDNIIYIFEDGRVYTYDIETKNLNEYLIELNLKSAQLFYRNNILYILGGFREYEYSVSPSSNVYSIDVDEFKKTLINKTTSFNLKK